MQTSQELEANFTKDNSVNLSPKYLYSEDLPYLTRPAPTDLDNCSSRLWRGAAPELKTGETQFLFS